MTSSSPSSAGASSPVSQFTCEQATIVVVGVTAFASSLNGTARTFAPRALATSSGPIIPGCSLSDVTISSPSPAPMPASTPPIPSVVDVVSAISDTSACSTLRVAGAQVVEQVVTAHEVLEDAALGGLRSELGGGLLGASRGIGPSVPAFR